MAIVAPAAVPGRGASGATAEVSDGELAEEASPVQ